MFAKTLMTALAAAGAVSAASSSSTCTKTTFTINSQADFDTYAGCSSLTGDVVLGTATDATIDLTGPKTIKGDLKLANNPNINTFKSSSLTSISGAFTLQNLTTLTTLAFTELTSVGSISMTSLTTLDTLTFSASIQKADSIVVSDTFLSSLDGLDVSSAKTIDINNNRRLVEFTSSIGNLSDTLNINANGLNLKVDFPNLIWIANMTISNVSSFSVPSLAVVNGSLRFDSNYITSFSAPNLTSLTSGDVSFVSNADLTNITIPALTSVGGGFQIANNTALRKINGFAKLKSVGGAIKLRGNFTEVSLPSLADVKGAFDVISTADITDSCNVFAKLAPSKQGGNGDIQGTYDCTSNIANANSDTSTSSSGSSTTTSSSGASSTDKGSSANGLSVNAIALLGLAGVAALFQTL